MKKIAIWAVAFTVSLVMSHEGNTETFRCIDQGTIDRNEMLCTEGVSKRFTLAHNDIQCLNTPNTPHGVYCTYVE